MGFGATFPLRAAAATLSGRGSRSRIGAALATWAEASSRPLVIFLDEIDALRDEALVSVLRQLRDGYPHHPSHFPHSLALIGMRDSPFNVTVRSLTTQDTGQPFEPEALELAFELTQGQPWLVNSLAKVAVEECAIHCRAAAAGAAPGRRAGG